MLLNSTQVITRTQHEKESDALQCKMEELNNNTVRLIAEVEKLIQGSKRLSEQIKSFRESPGTRPKVRLPSMHY